MALIHRLKCKEGHQGTNNLLQAHDMEYLQQFLAMHKVENRKMSPTNIVHRIHLINQNLQSKYFKQENMYTYL